MSVAKSRNLACVRVVLALLAALAFGAPSAHAKPGDLLLTIQNPTPAADDQFGYCLAMMGGNILVGSPGDDTAVSNAGAAYLFDGSTGALLRMFLNPTPAVEEYFGTAVAAIGNNVFVGDSRDAGVAKDAGAVHMFDAATGALIRTFQMPVPVANGYFGASLATMGNRIIVGSTMVQDVYMFDVLNGALLRRFVNPAPKYWDYFGSSIAVVGSNVLVGAWGNGTDGTQCGIAYLYDGETGSLVRTIHNPTLGEGEHFGYSVAAVGDNVLIGAENDSGTSNDGAAYLFDGATGDLLQTFPNPTPVPNDCFGCSVSAAGGNVLVGSYQYATSTNQSGGAYLFDGATGELLLNIANPTPAHGDAFGWCVAGAGEDILVGCLYDDLGGTDGGAVYLFKGVPEPATLAMLACGAAAMLRRRRGRFAWMLLAALAFGASSAQAKPGDLLLTIQNPTPAATDQFSNRLAAMGGNILVGAPRDDTRGYDAGAAYLFDGLTGGMLQTFLNPNTTGDGFGECVAGYGDNVFIGAYTADIGAENAGAVHMFDASTGALVRTFQSPVPVKDGFFGYSVAPMGDRLVIGSTYTQDVYMLEVSTGILLRTFVNPNRSFRDYFGWSIAVVGDNVLVGAWGDGTEGSECGMAYLFDGETGSIIRTIHNPTPAAGDDFGYSVAAVGDNVLISARHDGTGGSNSGAAYLFDGSTGDLLHTFLIPAPEGNESFGCSVAAVGGNVLIGAHLDDEGASDTGSAYLFDGSTGQLLLSIPNPTPASEDRFGHSVGGVGNNILVGCLYDDAGGTDVGAVYLYEGVPEPATLALLACGAIALLGRRPRARA